MENGSRILVWLVGLLIVLAAVYVLWSTTELSNIVPEGVVIAIVLLILGLGVMGVASQIRGERRVASTEVVRDRGVGYDPATERRVDYDDERRI